MDKIKDKQDNKLLLSICIPTYNRANYLDQLLKSIEINIVGFENQIEIVISNNAGTDNTDDIVAKYRSKFNDLNYLHLTTSLLPPEKNFYFVGSQAKGKYVWIIGDDDCLSDGAIKKVLQELTCNPELCICNFSMYSKDLQTEYKKKYYSTKLPNKILTANQLLKIFGSTLSLLSIVIIKRELLANVNYEKYLDYSKYGISFLFLVYSTISFKEKCNSKYIQQSIIKYRSENSEMSKDIWVTIFVEGMGVFLNDLKSYNYSKKNVDIAKNMVIIRYVFRELLSVKANGCDTSFLIKKLYTFYKDTSMFWVLCIPIIIIPKVFFSMVRIIYRNLIKPFLQF